MAYAHLADRFDKSECHMWNDAAVRRISDRLGIDKRGVKTASILGAAPEGFGNCETRYLRRRRGWEYCRVLQARIVTYFGDGKRFVAGKDEADGAYHCPRRLMNEQAVDRMAVIAVDLAPVRMLSRILESMFDAIDLVTKS